MRKGRSKTSSFESFMIGTSIGLLASLFIFNFVIMVGHIPTGSMEKTIMVGDKVVVNRLPTELQEYPKINDIVVFDQIHDGEEIYMIKRVVGLPGDNIKLRNGKLIRNDVEQDESEYTDGMTEVGKNGLNQFDVPEGKLLMFGDNRERSADSRYWDDPYVDFKVVKGKVAFRFDKAAKGAPSKVK